MKLGIGSLGTLRKWVRRARIDGGQRPGVTGKEPPQLKALKKENAELRGANDILKAALGFLRVNSRVKHSKPDQPSWADNALHAASPGALS